MHKALRIVLVICLTLILIFPTRAAVITGKVYSWDTFEPLKKCIVVINTTPEQRIIAINGSYYFQVQPGTYILEVFYPGDPPLYANETIVVKTNGTYRIDILAQPVIEEVNLSVPELNFEIDEKARWNNILIPIFLVSSLAIFGVYYYISKRRKKDEETRREEESLPDDLKEILEIIRRHDGRITQKELRKITGFSEAKMSLMIADLERRGLVERVKKGRGNIIFLKE